MAQKDDYLRSIATSNHEEFFSDLYRRYFEEFHYSLPDDLDPDEYEPVTIEQLVELEPDSREELQAMQRLMLDSKKKVHLNFCLSSTFSDVHPAT